MPTGRPNGRPPKPVETKQFENRSNKTLNETTIGLKQEVKVPTLPKDYDAEARKWWKFIWENSPSSKQPDYFVMRLFLDSWLDYLFLSKGIRSGELPRIANNPNGTIQSHSYWNQLKDVKVQLNTLMSSLGLSPADRARLFLAADADAEREELQKLLGRKPKEI